MSSGAQYRYINTLPAVYTSSLTVFLFTFSFKFSTKTLLPILIQSSNPTIFINQDLKMHFSTIFALFVAALAQFALAAPQGDSHSMDLPPPSGSMGPPPTGSGKPPPKPTGTFSGPPPSGTPPSNASKS